MRLNLTMWHLISFFYFSVGEKVEFLLEITIVTCNKTLEFLYKEFFTRNLEGITVLQFYIYSYLIPFVVFFFFLCMGRFIPFLHKFFQNILQDMLWKTFKIRLSSIGKLNLWIYRLKNS